MADAASSVGERPVPLGELVAAVGERPVPLGELVAAVAANWAANPDSGSCHEHTDDSRGCRADVKEPPPPPSPLPPPETTLEELACVGQNGSQCLDGTTLAELLAQHGLEALAPALQGETLTSLLVRLDERPELLSHLKELGVCVLPQRQKLANALTKIGRARELRGVSTDLAAAPPASTIAPPAATPVLHLTSIDARALLIWSDGRLIAMNPPAGGALHISGLRPEGGVVRAARRLAALACCVVAIPQLAGDGGDGDGAHATDPGAYARALGCDRVHILLPARRTPHAARTGRTHTHVSAGGGGHVGETSDAATGAVRLLATIEMLNAPAAQAWTLERPITRRALGGTRIMQAVWRGGRSRQPHAARSRTAAAHDDCSAAHADGEGAALGAGCCAALRARLVQQCEGKGMYEVNFNESSGRPLSLSQQSAYAVRLVLDSGVDTWDERAWKLALDSGSIIVAVGDWLPPLPQLEPWVHFVPAAVDLSDLDDRVHWALHHADAQAVAQRGRQLFDAELRAGVHPRRPLIRLFAELAREPLPT